MLIKFEDQQKPKVFLGGTCNESPWREELKPMLEINYFDPVVKDWDAKAQQRELEERQTSDFVLYCITPRMTGVYSIAELIDDSNKRPEKTVFVLLTLDGDEEFDDSQLKSLERVGAMVETNGGQWFQSLEDAAEFMNSAGSRGGRTGEDE